VKRNVERYFEGGGAATQMTVEVYLASTEGSAHQILAETWYTSPSPQPSTRVCIAACACVRACVCLGVGVPSPLPRIVPLHPLTHTRTHTRPHFQAHLFQRASQGVVGRAGHGLPLLVCSLPPSPSLTSPPPPISLITCADKSVELGMACRSLCHSLYPPPIPAPHSCCPKQCTARCPRGTCKY
jgi:hypothetical protein